MYPLAKGEFGPQKTQTGVPDMIAEEPNLLTTGQAAKLCSVTPDTVLKWIKKGRLHGARTAGGHYRIERRDLEPLIITSRSDDNSLKCDKEDLPCWEYLGEHGAVRDDCRKCVVYRVRAARCFLMAEMDSDIGHARKFCQSSCEDCAYYRHIKGLPTNVLVVSRDDELVDLLGGNELAGISLRFAGNTYEASAIIQVFRPAFAVIDVEGEPTEEAELVESFAADPRVAGLRIIIIVPPRMSRRKRRLPQNDLVVGMLEKPFARRQLEAIIQSSFIRRSPIQPLLAQRR